MARAIRLAAPPLAVLLIVGVVVGVLLSSGKSSSHHHGGTSATGASAPQAEATLDRVGGASADAAHPRGDASGSGTGGTTASDGSSASGSSTAGHPDSGAGGTGDGTTGDGHGGVGSPTRNAGTAATPAPGAASSGTPSSPGGAPAVTADGKLASGSSETGAWATTSVLGPEIEPNVTAATITFAVPLARPIPEGRVVYVNEAEAKKPGSQRALSIREACGEGGTVQAPTAQPGHLCVYAGLEDLRDRDPSGGVPTHAVGGAQVPFVDAEFFAIMNRHRSEGADRTGATVAFGVPDLRSSAEEAADAYPHIIANGSWAVSAP